MGEVRVRQAGCEDEAALGQLGAMVHALHVAERPDVFRPLGAEQLAREWFRPALQSADTRVWLAEASSAAVGYILVKHHTRLEKLFLVPLRWCEIDQIAVAEGWRRRGVARALVDAAVADARASGFARVETVCWWFNAAARAFFSSGGFAPKYQRWELTGELAAQGSAGAAEARAE